MDLLERRFDASQAQRQAKFAQALLAQISSLRQNHDEPRLDALSLPLLERLLRFGFNSVHPSGDPSRPSGRPYTPDERDDARHGRDAILHKLLAIPGRATSEVIRRLSLEEDFPVSTSRLRKYALSRAATDSEMDPWRPEDVLGFEDVHAVPPRTSRDLQRLVSGKLADLAYDLQHGDFAQAATLASFEAEVDVQNWLADRLRREQGNAYSLEREVHVAGEKEPDIRFRTKNDAALPMEIKVAESWSLPELEAALGAQLVGQYLRSRLDRHGILLLVHARPRKLGWRTSAGGWFSFHEVVEHLRGMARGIASSGSDAAQPEIVSLDVSEARRTQAA